MTSILLTAAIIQLFQVEYFNRQAIGVRTHAFRTSKASLDG